ncbi:hypothetical protein [Campylobacter curvus]|uniref:hypothetical protein n=1 Tax=Campylobacter curvus TaxID=200 RepID=UPI002016707A|nr:hypothetical protein [Campylobacter curvus]
MQKDIVLKSENLLDYQAFILFFSRQARKQYLLNTFGISGEAMLAGFIVDMLTKTQVFTVIGIVFGLFWLVFYPIFLKNRRKAALKNLSLTHNEKHMKFEVNENFIAFYENEPSENEKFSFASVSEIYELKNIFIIFLYEKIHLIIPKDADSAQMISLVAKNANKHILRLENFEFKSLK